MENVPHDGLPQAGGEGAVVGEADDEGDGEGEEDENAGAHQHQPRNHQQVPGKTRTAAEVTQKLGTYVQEIWDYFK